MRTPCSARSGDSAHDQARRHEHVRARRRARGIRRDRPRGDHAARVAHQQLEHAGSDLLGALLDACVDHVLALTGDGPQLQQGRYSDWKRNREYAEACERARHDKLRKDARRLTEAARRSAGKYSHEVPLLQPP